MEEQITGLALMILATYGMIVAGLARNEDMTNLATIAAIVSLVTLCAGLFSAL